MKINALLMVLLMGMSFFAVGISSIVVDADSAAGGNDASDNENSATLIPSENTWYQGDVNSTSDENDYYKIDVNPGEIMEFEVTGPSQGSYWFYYKLNYSQSWAGPIGGYEILSGNSYVFSTDNQDGQQEQSLILYFQANQQHIGFDLDYCFKVNHLNNFSQPQNSNSCLPVVAPSAPSVSVSGNTEGTSIMWLIDYVNLTNDVEVTLNYTITHDSSDYESNSILWAAQYDSGSEFIETNFVTAGEWCMYVTLWQHDQPQHVSDSFCITVEEVGNSMVNIDWIDTDASLGGGDAQFSVESSGDWTAYWGITNTNSAPTFPLWDYGNGWWDASASGGLGTTTGSGDSTWIFQNMEAWGALAPPSCNILMIALFDGDLGEASAQSTPATGDPVSVDYQTFEYGDITAEDCDWDSSWTGESNSEPEWITFEFTDHESNVVEDGESVEGEYSVGNMVSGVNYNVNLTVWHDDGTLFQTHSYVEYTTFTSSDANPMGIYNNAEKGDFIPLASSGSMSGCFYALVTLFGDGVFITDTIFEFSVVTNDCNYHYSAEEGPYLHVENDQRHWSSTGDVIISFEAGGLDPSIEWVLEAQLAFLPGIIDPEPNYELEWVELMLTADSVNDPREGISVDENGMSTFELDLWGLSDECYLLEYGVADKETLGTFMVGPFEHYFSVGMGDCGELIDNTVINDWCDQLEGFAGDVWDPLVTYSPGDVVEYPANSGQFYKAKTSTSGDIPSENSDAWEGPCTCEDIWQGQVWSSSVTYGNLEIVEENGKLWISQLNNNNGHHPSTSPNWWRACSSECALANGSVGWWFDQNYQLYQIGDVVEYPANSGKYFVSTMNDNSAHPNMGELRGWVECSCSEIWEGGSQPNWDANSHYDTFEVVEHNGEYYVRTFAFNLPFSTTPEPEVDSTWRAAWKKCDPDRCDSTGPYSQYFADMGIYDVDVAVSASFGSSKVWISIVEDNMNPPPSSGFFSATWAFCFKEPKPPIKPDLVADDWINPPGGIDDEIHRYARMMVGSVVSYTDEVTDQRIIDQRSGELCTDIDLDMYSGIDIKCEEIEVLVLGSETSTYGCFESWPSEEGKQLPWVEVCEFDDDSGPVVFENNPPIVVSSCDIDALNDVGVYIETNDMTDIGGHLLVEHSGMNPGDLNCGAQILLIDQNIEDHSEEDGVEGRTKYTCPPGRCFTDADGDCWVNVKGDGWLEGSWDSHGRCDTSMATGNSPFPPWLNIQDVKIGEDTYHLVSIPGQTCDTVDLSNLMPGSTCSDAVTQIGQSTNPSTTSTSTRSPGGPCTDANHQLYQTIISSSAADTRWLGPNGLMQPSNLVTPDPSWGTFTTWGDAVWVGQPSHSSATTQPQSYFFSHEFTLPYHAKELDFSWHGMASDHFGLDQSNSKSGGVSIDGYPAAGFTEIILIDPATWNSAPHHDQEEQWTGGKTFTPVNPNQKYILQTIISNDDTQSIQGVIYELKVEFCMDPQYEHHLPDLPIMDEPDVDPGLPDLPVVDQVPDDSIPGFLGIFGILALVAAAITSRKN